MPERLAFDRDLKISVIQALAGADAVASFFAHLGYDIGRRVTQTPAAMGVTADSLARKILHIERVAEAEPEALQVYLIELDSVTVATLNGLARALRNRAGDYLLVVTSDYEQLHFVLIEREAALGGATRLATPQVVVRPRALAVRRRDPGRVALRALRRFTYTEVDAYAQYDKLRSAFTVAEWAEPLFNNRALVSDYFLTERLPTWPEWAEDPRPTYRALVDLYVRARERFGGRDDAVLSAELIAPVLGELGFTAAAADGGDAPDLWLTGAEGDRVACLLYPWDRYLDGRDETRDSRRAAETPGARVVSVLQGSDAGWAIVTNGKLWRLYSGAAHSTATNYYEIDLEETLAASDPNEAFRYFWLLFRAAAFSVAPTAKPFVERLVAESEAFATSLGEQLKSRVFDEIFPRLAEGFMAHRRATEPEAPIDQTLLDATFRATLTLLYRVLFILFAEARDLLPVREAHGYAGRSLQHLKQEIADRAGPLLDQREAHLRARYASDAGATGLYETLLALSRAIDRGDPSVNLPFYDGGLFLTDPDPDDETPEAAAARFLAAHRVPDAPMAIALDLLARAVDPKRGDLVFIDYKSLGVRQLGSIYEGLLEFKLRLAGQRMAIVRGKRTEEVVPYEQAAREKRTVLRDGRGKSAPERTLEPGAVYLENDKRERRATGSYYTPDHIVQYIVREAVGPALGAHLERLRPRMREAQQAYRQAVDRAQAFQKQGMRGDDPDKVANDPRWMALADEVFEVRVLDPAMGSGHFLVEAVDFITDRLLVFLNGFPWNPVQAALRRTRETIQNELERQGVTIDARKLNDLNLLKRQVLKRCVYGVDLNPMGWSWPKSACGSTASPSARPSRFWTTI